MLRDGKDPQILREMTDCLREHWPVKCTTEKRFGKWLPALPESYKLNEYISWQTLQL
jgi:hypothetical protein